MPSSGAPGLSGTPSGLFVDDLFRPGDTEIEEAGLHEGAVVTLTSSTPDGPPRRGPCPTEGSLALTVVTGPDAGRVVPLPTDGEYRIGRGPECHIRLLDPTLSRLHCGLQVSTVGTVTVVNLSTSVGTRIAGATITSPEPVALGTPILLGTTTSWRWTASATKIGCRASPGLVGWGHRERSASTARPGSLPNRSISAWSPPSSRKMPASLRSTWCPWWLPRPWDWSWCSPFTAPCTPCSRLLSPIMVAGNWWESKHRSSKALRTSTRNYARDLVALRSDAVGVLAPRGRPPPGRDPQPRRGGATRPPAQRPPLGAQALSRGLPPVVDRFLRRRVEAQVHR